MKPSRIEEERVYMIGLIRSAQASCIPVAITLYGKFNGLRVTGNVAEIDEYGVKIYLDESENEWRWIPFGYMIAAEFEQGEWLFDTEGNKTRR